MADREKKRTNDASDSSDNRAPLSSYLPYNSREDEQEGWMVFSSENEGDQSRRAPNLSVLKQIKSFLSNKPEEAETPFDSSDPGTQSFRVDYPYYDSEPEAARQVLEESGDESDVPDFVRELPEPAVLPTTVSASAPQCVVELPITVEENVDAEYELPGDQGQISEQELSDSGVETESDAKEESVMDARTVEESSQLQEEDPEPTAEESVETTDVVSFDAIPRESARRSIITETIEPAAFTLDADELIGTTFQEVAPVAETRDVSTIVETPCRAQEEETGESVAFGGLPESNTRIPDEQAVETDVQEELRIVEAPRQDFPVRRASKRRLPIFQRVVDLVTRRESTPEKSGEAPSQRGSEFLEEVRVKEATAELVDPTITVELVVAPCYMGAELNNPFESYIVGGGENAVS